MAIETGEYPVSSSILQLLVADSEATSEKCQGYWVPENLILLYIRFLVRDERRIHRNPIEIQ